MARAPLTSDTSLKAGEAKQTFATFVQSIEAYLSSRIQLGVALLAGLAAAPAYAQFAVKPAPVSNLSVPFERWLAEGNRKEIPWRLELSQPRLRPEQRIGFAVHATIPGKHLAGLEPGRNIYLGARIRDEQGQWLGHNVVGALLDKQLPQTAALSLMLRFYIQPGDYHVAVFLYDDASQEHSFATRRLRVRPLRNDPLAGSDANLPRVEAAPPESGLDALYQPRITSRPAWPVVTKRPLRIEVIAVATGTEGASPSSRNYAVSALKVLSQMDLDNGTLHVTVLDISRRKLLFEQENVRSLDWTGLRTVLEDVDPATISIQALQGSKEAPAFFRHAALNKLRNRISPDRSPASSGNGASVAAVEPLRILIVVSSALHFEGGADLTPVPAEACGACRVYFLRQFSWAARTSNPWHYGPDQLEQLLKPLSPRTFTIYFPEDFRRALGQILKDLRQY